MSNIVKGLGMEPVCTKDGSLITADYSKQFATVVFYTSGDLCTMAKPDKKGTEDKFPVDLAGRQGGDLGGDQGRRGICGHS